MLAAKPKLDKQARKKNLWFQRKPHMFHNEVCTYCSVFMSPCPKNALKSAAFTFIHDIRCVFLSTCFQTSFKYILWNENAPSQPKEIGMLRKLCKTSILSREINCYTKPQNQPTNQTNKQETK